MFKNLCLTLFIVTLLCSCSSDKKEPSKEEEAIASIVGVWDATSLKLDEDTASQDAIIMQQFLEILVKDNCYILTLEFNEDLTASANNAAAYIEIDTSSLEVACPTDYDVQTSTYTFDGEVATIVNPEGVTIEVAVRVDGDLMYVDAEDLEIPDFSDSGELVFKKR